MRSKPWSIGIAATVFASMIAMPSAAEGKKIRFERVVEYEYDSPIIGAPGVIRLGQCGGAPNNGCADVLQGPRERYLSIEISDASGAPSYAEIFAGKNEDLLASVCGSSEEPTRINSGMQLRVFVYASGPAGCAGTASTGVITATLSNLP